MKSPGGVVVTPPPLLGRLFDRRLHQDVGLAEGVLEDGLCAPGHLLWLLGDLCAPPSQSLDLRATVVGGEHEAMAAAAMLAVPLRNVQHDLGVLAFDAHRYEPIAFTEGVAGP